ncbi:MAG: UDP-N-acetylmuramyl-tripeptide synthetase [Spirochaetia bacterium]|nr:UDP-N-acetylmuramyl-tripeptide synthetase [Spirochaetia bacterium]
MISRLDSAHKKEKSLKKLLTYCETVDVSHVQDHTIEGFSLYSDSCSKNYIFFACPGFNTDGHNYISDAVSRGASVIVYEHYVDDVNINPFVTYIKVENSKKALAQLASAYFKSPSSDMTVIGITGTDGKTTASYFLFQLLVSAGKKVGIISGVYTGTHEELYESSHMSTPESYTIEEKLFHFREAGCEFAVIEVTSHALSELHKRVDAVNFDIFIFTPITSDHLNFHGDLSTYVSTKFRALELLGSSYSAQKEKNVSNFYKKYPQAGKSFNKGIVTTSANAYFRELFKRSDSSWTKVLSVDSTQTSAIPGSFGTSREINDYDTGAGADHLLTSQSYKKNTTELLWDNMSLGYFNRDSFSEYQIMDLKLALSALPLLHIDISEIVPGLSKLKKVKGRNTIINLKKNRRIVIDYAHTAHAVRTILAEYRYNAAFQKIIVVMGAAGDRDRSKRPEMAAAADFFADIIIFTTEDPFNENQMQIFSDLRRGIKNKIPGKELFFIPNRREAVRWGINELDAKSCLLILGKGHERFIHYSDRKEPWNDLEETKKMLDTHNVSINMKLKE